MTEAGKILKRACRRLVGDAAVGMLDYIRFPSRSAAWGGPLNGQPARQALFLQIIDEIRPRAIIETGTYLGTTTDFMAGTGLPVYTVEADQRSYGFARARFWRRRNVTVLQGDSRETLRRLLDGSLRTLTRNPLFFYFDAHWNDDLPLVEELEIVFSRCPAAVAMIDDFQVPFDAGYGYDDYGPGKALIASYIAPAVSRYQLLTLYPATPSVAESGMRRGCVVLAKENVHGKALALVPLLRRAEETEPTLIRWCLTSEIVHSASR
jgi:hypothetical protein